MYLKKTPQKNGRIFLSIVDGYRDKQKGHSRQITIEKLGYLDDLEKQYDDTIAFFVQRVQKLKDEKAERKAAFSFTFDSDEQISSDMVYRKNFGHMVFSSIYHELEINKFMISRQHSTKLDFDTNNIMKLLVFSRLLAPTSKKKTFECRESYFEKPTILWMMCIVVSPSLTSKAAIFNFGLIKESDNTTDVTLALFIMM